MHKLKIYKFRYIQTIVLGYGYINILLGGLIAYDSTKPLRNICRSFALGSDVSSFNV